MVDGRPYVGDSECFAFLKSIQGNKRKFYIDRGWKLRRDENGCFEGGYSPPGFKIHSGLDKVGCAWCSYRRSEYGNSCKHVEVLTGVEVMKPKDYISPGHSNPVFGYTYFEDSVCDYFIYYPRPEDGL